jgi:hypothetical protein
MIADEYDNRSVIIRGAATLLFSATTTLLVYLVTAEQRHVVVANWEIAAIRAYQQGG